MPAQPLPEFDDPTYGYREEFSPLAEDRPPKTLSLPHIGMMLALVAIGAFFIALIIGFWVMLKDQPKLESLRVPVVLWWSTALLVASSATLEWARHAIWRALVTVFLFRLRLTAAIGILFIGLQLFAWRQLAEQGVYLEANLRGSAFYVFSGIHAAHLLYGVISLIYLYRRAQALHQATEHDLRKFRISGGAIGMYWHFMGGLWLLLFGCLVWWTA